MRVRIIDAPFLTKLSRVYVRLARITKLLLKAQEAMAENVA